MGVLDDPAALRAADPDGLLDAFRSLPEQLEESFAASAGVGGVPPGPRAVVLCGMGGSAAAGDVVRGAYADRLPAPVLSIRGSRIPAALGPDDLAICLSFSGNTEETLTAFDRARARGCAILAVCSGGALAERAAAAGAPLALVRRSVAMPRAALGHLTGGLVGALSANGLIPAADDDVAGAGEALAKLAGELAPEAGGGEGGEVAAWLGERTPVIWGSEGVSEAAAWRWKCAFNENAKVPAFASSLPELDHHEVVGWGPERGEGFALVILREEDEEAGTAARIEATLEAIAPAGLEAIEVRGRGGSALSRALSLMLIGDVASTYHALARGIDPSPIAAIDALKRGLAGPGAA